MKLISSLVIILGSLPALAASSTTSYSVGDASVVWTQPGVSKDDVKSCPKILSLSVTSADPGAALVSATVMTDEQGLPMPIKAKADGSSTSCVSDIVCPTQDSFKVDNETSFTLVRNNDGQYPTHDLPGYSVLEIRGIFAPGRTFSCYYSVK